MWTNPDWGKSYVHSRVLPAAATTLLWDLPTTAGQLVVPRLRSVLAESCYVNCLNSHDLLMREEVHLADLSGQWAPSS